jgi:hypothetical protein
MKYKVKFSAARIKRLYSAGKNVSQIAQAIGYPAGTGNNKVRNVLGRAGAYKSDNKVTSPTPLRKA